MIGKFTTDFKWCWPYLCARYRQMVNSVHWADHGGYHYNLACKELQSKSVTSSSNGSSSKTVY